MNRFYFNVRSSVLMRDLEGSDLSSLEAARVEASESARELVEDGYRFGEDRRHWAIEIADESGEMLLSVPFAPAGDELPCTLAA
jgi:hypothetical protein